MLKRAHFMTVVDGVFCLGGQNTAWDKLEKDYYLFVSVGSMMNIV